MNSEWHLRYNAQCTCIYVSLMLLLLGRILMHACKYKSSTQLILIEYCYNKTSCGYLLEIHYIKVNLSLLYFLVLLVSIHVLYTSSVPLAHMQHFLPFLWYLLLTLTPKLPHKLVALVSLLCWAEAGCSFSSLHSM